MPGPSAALVTAIGPASVSVAIPTFGREQVLVDTLRAVLALEPAAAEVLVLDQTPEHEAATQAALEAWHRAGAIRWNRLPRPSITQAMNQGLLLARQPLVLFLDDDVVPAPGLIAGHQAAYADLAVWGVVGQVLQPNQQVIHVDSLPAEGGLRRDLAFPFNSDRAGPVRNCIACNLSVRRESILAMGGFDENFVQVAYRFETEFARRIWQSGGKLRFEPAASLRHVQAARGGTRSFGNHLRTMRPAHSVGDYYFALSTGWSAESLKYCLARLSRSAATRFHLSHPWWIGPKLLGELGGLVWAVRLALAGPKLLRQTAELPGADEEVAVPAPTALREPR